MTRDVYPHLQGEDRYEPYFTPDGGISTVPDWHYKGTPEQAKLDAKKAYETNTPYGYIPKTDDKYANDPKCRFLIRSLLHTDEEYGGPFYLEVSPKITITELRLKIKEACGITPAIQKLAYAGINMEESHRTLESYSVAYWHRRFPEWPISIRRY